MARPRKYGERVDVFVRMPPELRKRLLEAAEERDLSMNYLALRAIEEFLDRLVPIDEWKLTR